MDLPSFVREHVALAPLTTLELGGAARFFVDATDEPTILAALEWAQREKIAFEILGGGSNLIVRDEGTPSLVIHLRSRGERVEDLGGGRVRVSVAAGEPWDEFVGRCVRRKLGGVECLSGIPGSVGATPIQNVGAYGQDVSETIESVRVWDPKRSKVRELTAEQCGFGYRDSAFKHRKTGLSSCVVLEVRFVLRVNAPVRVRYSDLQIALAEAGVGEATIEDVRSAVLAVRKQKSMVISADDPNRRSVGSFFKNPMATPAGLSLLLERMAARSKRIMYWDDPRGGAKLSAASLIEQSGFAKGTRRGNVGISSKHALALVNNGGATCAELLAFADEITASVREQWDVRLEREPVLW